MLLFKFSIIRINKWGLFVLLWHLFAGDLASQATNIGIPFTTSYPNEVYQAGTQNWDIDQHPNGFMFFANNNGLLQFDGINWETFPLKNKTIARSLHITAAGRIYVGGQGEFGYFAPNEMGELIFHSLVDLVPKMHRNFSDVWKIIEKGNHIFFNASDKFFKYDGNTITIFQKGQINFIGEANQRIFLKNQFGLNEFKEDKIFLVPEGDKLATMMVEDLFENAKQEIIISTLHNGLFKLVNNQIIPLHTNNYTYFKSNRIHCAEKLMDSGIVVGTADAGLIILDSIGQPIYKLDKKNGLQNNHVLSIFKDKADNLWLGLDNGIDYVSLNAPFTRLTPDGEQEGTAYAAKIYRDQLYLGTSTGLYLQDWKSYYNPHNSNTFQLVPESNGQVWGLNQIQDDLFLGHHTGGFLLKNQQLEKISPVLGNWTALALAKHPNYFIIGTYEGLVLYRKEGANWEFIRKFEGLKESCRLLEQDEDGNIWVSHPYRGIYKIQIAEDLSNIQVKLYGAADGLPSNNLNHVFKINKAIIFTGETGVFKFDTAKDRFIRYPPLDNLIDSTANIQRFFEDATGNIWFVTNRATGILKINDQGITKSFTKTIYPELRNKLVRGFELIYPHDAHNVFIGAEEGFIHFNPTKSLAIDSTAFTSHIVKVRTINQTDSVLIYGQYNSIQSKLSNNLPYENNALRFSYAATDYTTTTPLQYSTKLKGFEKNWSTWSTKTEKDFTNLNAGTYHFLVKAKSIYKKESEVASFTFTINAPWYASTQAIAIYALAILAFLSGLIVVPRRKYQVEKAALEANQKRKDLAYQKEVAQSKEAIISLKNQQLEAQIVHKNSELAISTMHLVQRSELIQQIQERLNKVAKSTNDSIAAKELRKVNRLLKENTQLDDLWNQFAYHFDQVHIDFLQKIQEKFPVLTANDQKLCAYLRMNLSTKEIAPLMNISIRGVEVARYRLRKKLSLGSTVNLNKFMLEF